METDKKIKTDQNYDVKIQEIISKILSGAENEKGGCTLSSNDCRGVLIKLQNAARVVSLVYALDSIIRESVKKWSIGE